ncbi:MAG: hypothetical protein WAQ25_04415, partial [Candidatus Saccharimonas sp.]
DPRSVADAGGFDLRRDPPSDAPPLKVVSRQVSASKPQGFAQLRRNRHPGGYRRVILPILRLEAE